MLKERHFPTSFLSLCYFVFLHSAAPQLIQSLVSAVFQATLKLHERTALHCLMIPVLSVPELGKHLLHKYVSKHFHCQLTRFKRGLCSRICQKWAGRNTSDNQEGSKRRSSKRNEELHRRHFLECKKKTLCDSKQFSNLNELAHIYNIYGALGTRGRVGWDATMTVR